MAIGGDIIEVTYQHPDLGSGTFFPKSAEDSTFDPGGFRSNDDANMLTSGGEMIDQMNRVRWSFETVIAWDANVRDEMTTLKDLASSPKQATYTITSVNGTVWSGKGKPVGDIQPNGNAATCKLKLSGGGEMKKISG